MFSVYISLKMVTDFLRNKDRLPLAANQSLQEPYLTDFRWVLRMFERKTCGLNIVNGYNLEKSMNSSVRVRLDKISGARSACHAAALNFSALPLQLNNCLPMKHSK